MGAGFPVVVWQRPDNQCVGLVRGKGFLDLVFENHAVAVVGALRIQADEFCQKMVLAQALAHTRRYQAAAVAYLRVPIVYRAGSRLESESFFGAAQSLERLGQGRDAAKLYRELIVKYPQATAAELARERLTALGEAAS